MTSSLRIIAGPDKGRDIPLSPTAPLIVGRAAGTDVRLSDKAVSSVHCQFFLEHGMIKVLDLGSKFGTFINGNRVEQATALKSGDIIRIGDTQVLLEADTEPPTITLFEKATPAAPPAAPLPPPSSGAVRSVKPGRPTVLPADRLQELSGQALAHFQIGPVLAQGENGLVFRAQDLKDQQPVALKVFWPEFAQDDDEVQRFVRAMKTLMPLKHPHLVTVRGAGKTGGYCWIGSDLIEGESLAQILARFGKGHALTWQYALRVGAHVARALVFIHHHQIMHRDITPANILVRSSDQVALLSGALTAKAIEGRQVVHLTKPGELPGDVRYMSPERTAGGAVPVDSRTDLYSLGATLYTLCAGQPPLEGKNFIQTVLKIQKETPVPLRQYQPTLPAPFETIIAQMLAKRADDRPQPAATLLAQLEGLARSLGVPT
jgi:serine/threonine protein kinase